MDTLIHKTLFFAKVSSVTTLLLSELLVGCSGNEVYRMSLEEGRFLNPYSTGLNDVTSLVTSDDHYLVSIGGSNGIVECWDPRARSCIGKCLPTRFRAQVIMSF